MSLLSENQSSGLKKPNLRLPGWIVARLNGTQMMFSVVARGFPFWEGNKK